MNTAQLRRYWVSWYSTNHIKHECTKPPFQFWVSGSCPDQYGIDQLTLCAVIECDDPNLIPAGISKHFPDAVMRFVEPVGGDWMPSSRFPGYEGLVSL